MTKEEMNIKTKQMIKLYKDLSPENQDLLREFANGFQKKVDELEETCSRLREQLIKVRNGSY